MKNRNAGAPERRYIAAPLTAIEHRNGGVVTRSLVGHAAVFNRMSQDLGGFVERIAPGAFSRAIQEDDVVALFEHDSRYVLGRVRAGTLTLAEDSDGLAVEISPPDTQLVRDMVLTPIARGDISQMSFGFRTVRDSWEKDAQGNVVRTLLEVQLFDVSPVTYPAYTQTDIAVRSYEQFLEAEARATATKTEQQRNAQFSVDTARRRLRIHGAD